LKDKDSNILVIGCGSNKWKENGILIDKSIKEKKTKWRMNTPISKLELLLKKML
jgi:hypothetical protein